LPASAVPVATQDRLFLVIELEAWLGAPAIDLRRGPLFHGIEVVAAEKLCEPAVCLRGLDLPAARHMQRDLCFRWIAQDTEIDDQVISRGPLLEILEERLDPTEHAVGLAGIQGVRDRCSQGEVERSEDRLRRGCGAESGSCRQPEIAAGFVEDLRDVVAQGSEVSLLEFLLERSLGGIEERGDPGSRIAGIRQLPAPGLELFQDPGQGSYELLRQLARLLCPRLPLVVSRSQVNRLRSILTRARHLVRDETQKHQPDDNPNEAPVHRILPGLQTMITHSPLSRTGERGERWKPGE